MRVIIPEIALKSNKEMYFQKGSTLRTDENGRAEATECLPGTLVLPGHAEESKSVLRLIAEELSPGVHLSLMSQYHPTSFLSESPSPSETALIEKNMWLLLRRVE